MKRLIIVFIAMFLYVLLAGTGMAGGRVLVVQSYHAEYDWVAYIDSAIERSFTIAKIPYRTFYMDTKRHPGKEYKVAAGKRAKQMVAEYKPRVVIAVDDNAQAYFVKDYVNRSEIQFVFCGVNADPQKYGYPADNVTGILERAYPDQVLRLLKLILPELQTAAYVSDDSATGDPVMPRTQLMAKSGQLPIQINQWFKPATFKHWRETIEKLEQDKSVGALLIPLYHTVKHKAGGQSKLPADVMRWTVDHTAKPIVGYWSFSTDDGALCAVVVNPREHGRVAALMAKQILAGKKARDIPMVTNKDGFVIVNLKTAAKLNIDIPFEVLQSADKIIE